MQQLQESPPDILITLKKRPKHSKIYGQIYLKPYRLPSKKKVLPYRWGGGSDAALPSPRADMLPPIKDFPIQSATVSTSITTTSSAAVVSLLSQVPEQPEISTAPPSSSSSSSSSPSTASSASSSSDSECSDVLTPNCDVVKVSDKDLRLYLPKPRAVLQRRNTICGDQVSGFKSNVMFWHEYKSRSNADDSPSLRDKSVSFGFGLEIAPRPTTCLGIGNVTGCGGVAKFNDFSGLKGSLPEMANEKVAGSSAAAAAATATKTDDAVGGKSLMVLSKPGVSKVVRLCEASYWC